MNSKEPTVWLLQDSYSSNSDLSSAQRYGKIIPILNVQDYPGRMPGPAISKLKKALKEYRPGDYICYGLSDPASAFLAGMVFGNEGLAGAPINWLRWERERSPSGDKIGGFFTPTQIIYP